MLIRGVLPCLWFFLAGLLDAAEDPPDFNREIRPILSENCFHCHGPDEKSREGGLRLDTFEGANEGGEFAEAVVPGKPHKSEVIARIHADDANELMPPRDSKRTLTGKEKELLEKWIASGAKYEEHWAWVAPVRGRIPKVKNASRVNNPVDAYLLRRLESEGLGFSERAPEGNLLRRLSLDLIGLPPSPEDLQRFLESGDYEAEVDRLLASPRFGERWARHWLDLARYADSNGFQADQLRPSWAYRDWVIDALNDNMPYDQFTVEQLAGDLLPKSDLRQKIATGFHRTVTCNVEAGVSPEGNRVNQVFDRVNTTATVWLGITLECAQCHDHKFDPFTMKDYYTLFAFFNNTPLEVQPPSNKKDVSHDFVGPYLDLPLTPEQVATAGKLDEDIAALSRDLERLGDIAGPEFKAWQESTMVSLANQPEWKPMAVKAFSSSGDGGHRVLADGSVLLTGKIPDTATYTVEVGTDLETITGLRLEALTHPELPGNGPGRGDALRSNFVLHEFKVAVTQDRKERQLKLRNARADFSQKDWEVSGALDGKAKTGWAISPQFGEPHFATFQLDRPLVNARGASLVIRLEQNFGQGRVIGNFRLSAIFDPSGVVGLPPRIVSILKKAEEKRNAEELDQLRTEFLKSDGRFAKLEAQLARLKKEKASLKPDQTLVMVELDEPRETRILKRGNFLAPDVEVFPATPERLPKLENPSNRLDLANWLVRRDNPLTARVAVNRWWAELFGRGIVATLEDFGTQSDPPTHPELLDWLAVELMESGWNMKHVLKTILMSQGYQQSSRVIPYLLEKDPRNLLHARAPRFRMDAERLRDNALTISGLLSTKMHGKPIMPYQPGGLWRQTGRNEPKWEEQKDENRWRRGIYIVYRRAAPYPSMVNFDAPDRSSCTVRRPRTNTPNQALTMLNDPAYVEMALALADRILTESADPSERIDHAFQLALSRRAMPREVKILEELTLNRSAFYKEHPEKVSEILGSPRFFYKPRHESLVELATWLHVANALLNLDEALTRN
ncbi:MAG: PSD1 and planctomycete cytochrome C domain-containing protein [Akkermansiaceae bacterium]|nr:PSD1 and planctomycete cytochrome C domain-containing protein [Akkermansiaceae bacterium]